MKDYTMKILNGLSLGIVTALIPSALLGELSKALGWAPIVQLTAIAVSMVPMAIGVAVAHQFKFNPLQTICLAIAVVIGSGVVKFTDAGMVIKGTGDVINAGLTAALAAGVVLMLNGKAKNFAILITPIFVSILAGGIGLLLLPFVVKITAAIGSLIAHMTTLQPILMGILISVSYAFLIVSPVSTVGVALAVGLTGIASGTANLGVVAASFGLAIGGISVNGLGLSLAPVLGSPKIFMGNLAKQPKILLPILANAAVLGALGAAFGIPGTPFSAGFGISGLIGPINALNIMGWNFGSIAVVIFLFLIAPIALGFLFRYLLIDKAQLVEREDYKLEIV
ncbi:MAG: PTS sugar transporter subunit IIC [Spirochaetales bacterium]|nr:PTS sugar transporter subunit IIC [Spirochaetales bacterium]